MDPSFYSQQPANASPAEALDARQAAFLQQQQQQLYHSYSPPQPEPPPPQSLDESPQQEEEDAPLEWDEEAREFEAGDEVLCERHGGAWFPARVLETSIRSKKRQQTTFYRTTYDGRSNKYDEWVEDKARFRSRTQRNLATAQRSRAIAERIGVAFDGTPRRTQPSSQSAQSSATKRKSASPGGASSSSKKKPKASQSPVTPRRNAHHPTYVTMVEKALEALASDKSKSVSAVAVGKWIKDRYPVHETKYKTSVSAALKQGVSAGKFVKVKASFRFSNAELRNRERSRKGLPPQAAPPPKLKDDLELLTVRKVKPLPLPQFLLCLSPPQAGGDIVSVCEFFHHFHDVLLPPKPSKKKQPPRRRRLSVADLDCALSVLPLEGPHPEARLPPLLERLVLALLRAVLGRAGADGDVLENGDLLEETLFVGHNQNRRVWGHCLNAATWPDVLRRHLGAERRFRDRVRRRWRPRQADDADKETNTLSRRRSFLATEDADADAGAGAAAKKEDDDEPALALACREYCDERRAFGELSAESCAAILKSLADDALETAPIFGSKLRESEEALENAEKRLKTVQTVKRKIEKLVAQNDEFADVEQFAIRNRQDALLALAAVTDDTQQAYADAKATAAEHHLRREEIGADRYCGRYWASVASANRAVSLPAPEQGDGSAVSTTTQRLVIRVGDGDDRNDVVIDPWCAFDGGSGDAALRKALDPRGAREKRLLDGLDAAVKGPPEVAVEAVSEALLRATRELLPRILRRPPPSDTVAGAAPWPAALDRTFEAAVTGIDAATLEEPPSLQSDDDDDEDEEDDAEEEGGAPRAAKKARTNGDSGGGGPPRRSTRLVVAASAKEEQESPPAAPKANGKAAKKKPADEEADTPANIDRRAEEAAALAAPWRRRHPTIAHALLAFRTEVDCLAERLDALSRATRCAEDPLVAAALATTPRFAAPAELYAASEADRSAFLRALRDDALTVEAATDALLRPNAALTVEDAHAVLNGAAADDKQTDWLDFDWVERDEALEDDYFEIVGPCSDVPRWRELWVRAVAQIDSEESASFEARASRFATLFGSLAEAFSRHAPQLEARARAADKLLAGDMRAGKTVFLASTPGRVVWARMRGFPWWPAREHAPKASQFADVLARRSQHVVVFVGEHVQYLLHHDSVAPFTGDVEDPHLPKNAKSCTKSLARAIDAARAVLHPDGPPAVDVDQDNGDQDNGEDAKAEEANGEDLAEEKANAEESNREGTNGEELAEKRANGDREMIAKPCDEIAAADATGEATDDVVMAAPLADDVHGGSSS